LASAPVTLALERVLSERRAPHHTPIRSTG
jgi:hypothetical protein